MSDHEETEQLRIRVSRVARYLRAVTKDTDCAIWADFYVPVRAVRAADPMKPVAPRHTLTKDEVIFMALLSLPSQRYRTGTYGEVFE